MGVFLGHIPVGLGVPWWLALPLCAVGLTAVVLFIGKKSDELVDDEEHELVDESDDEDAAPEDRDEQLERIPQWQREDIRESVLAGVGSGSDVDWGNNKSTRFGL